MAKGVSVKLKSYDDTIPKLLKIVGLGSELKKHDKVVLKVVLNKDPAKSTKPGCVNAVLDFCVKNKNPDTQIFIAEGADGSDTLDLFEEQGYKKIAENYSVGLIDLNNTETKEIQDGEFLKFNKIVYPEILVDSFVISIPYLTEDEETGISGSLSAMLGAFPSSYYKGIFSSKKNKIRKDPIKFAIHDILKCKMPNLAIIDASEKGTILAGQPLEMDKQAATLLGKDWKSIQYIKLVSDSFKEKAQKNENITQTLSE